MRGITHINDNDKDSVSFTWMAPPEGTGRVTVLFSVAQTRTMYWSNQISTFLEGIYVCTMVDMCRTSTMHISTRVCNLWHASFAYVWVCMCFHATHCTIPTEETAAPTGGTTAPTGGTARPRSNSPDSAAYSSQGEDTLDRTPPIIAVFFYFYKLWPCNEVCTVCIPVFPWVMMHDWWQSACLATCAT